MMMPQGPGVQVTLSLWAKFTEFVKEQHLDFASQTAWDSLNADLEALAL